MKWNYCNYCPLDGTCENQDRGRECEMPVKKLLEENTQLRKFLEEFNALDVAKENQQLKFLLKECRYKIIADLDNARLCESSVDIEDFEYLLNRIDNAIGEKK